MIPSLAWIQEFHDSFNRAVDGISSGYLIEDHVDPLKKHVVFKLSEPLGGKNFQPFQMLAHGFAKANACLIERIYHDRDKLTLVICIKRRLGPTRKKNPISWG